MSSTGGWSRRPGAAACWLDTESCCPWRAVGLGDPWARCRGVVVLGCAAGAWVSVGLLLGLVVIHPVRERGHVVGVDQAIKGH